MPTNRAGASTRAQGICDCAVSRHRWDDFRRWAEGTRHRDHRGQGCSRFPRAMSSSVRLGHGRKFQADDDACAVQFLRPAGCRKSSVSGAKSAHHPSHKCAAPNTDTDPILIVGGAGIGGLATGLGARGNAVYRIACAGAGPEFKEIGAVHPIGPPIPGAVCARSASEAGGKAPGLVSPRACDDGLLLGRGGRKPVSIPLAALSSDFKRPMRLSTPGGFAQGAARCVHRIATDRASVRPAK